MATGAACCGAGALRPTRPRRDGVSEETQEQGGLPGEPWVGGMTRFSAGDCRKEAPQVPRAHASSQTTSLALGPLPPTQPSQSLSHARACGVWDQGATVSLVYTELSVVPWADSQRWGPGQLCSAELD